MKREVIIELQLQDADAVQKLGKLDAELKQVNAEYKDLTKEIKVNGRANAQQLEQLGQLVARKKNLSAQSRELSNDISGLTAAKMRFRDKMADASLEALKESGILGQLRASAEKLAAEFKAGTITQAQFEKGIRDINAQIAAQGSQFKQGIKDLKNYALGFFGVVEAARAIIGVFSDAARTVADFDKALSRIRALGGPYAENIDAIAEAAKTAGINFGFTATETLGAVEALAKAGVTTADILRGALPGALTLAAAGQLDVATAAETAAKAMTQFGLQGQDIPHLADLLAAGAATATGEVTDFAMALNQSGLVASQAGISIEETVGTLTAFASAGLLGSDAGTSFRTMLLRLQNPTKESADQMKALGLEVFDAQGEFIGLEQLAGQLQERLGGLTQEQRSAALAQIFGSDAVRAANVLYTQGAEGIAKYREEVSQSGFAQKVAEEQTNNLRGSLERAGAAYDAFILSLEDGSGPIARTIQGLVNMFATIFEGFAMMEARSTALRDLRGEFDDFAEATGQALDESLIEQELNRIRIQQIADARQQQDEFQIDLFENRRSRLEAQVRDLERQQGSLLPAQLVGLFALKVELKGLNEEIDRRKSNLEAQNKVQAAATIANAEETDSINNTTDAVKELTEAQKKRLVVQQEMQAAAEQPVEEMAVRSPTGQTVTPGQPLQAEIDRVDTLLELYAQERQAFEQLQDAKTLAAAAFANTVGQLAEEGSNAAKVFLAIEKAAAVANVIIQTQRAIAAATAAAASIPPLIPPGIPNPAYVAAQSIAAAQIATAKVTAATSIAQIIGTAIPGFAQGGQVRQSDGPRYTANPGDSVLISAAPGEVILTREQQRRLKALAGYSVFGDIGVPGFASGGEVRRLVRGTALVNLPQVSSGTVAQADLARMMRGLNISPIVRVTDVMDVMNSVRVAQDASTL